jgi:hypothetical protein
LLINKKLRNKIGKIAFVSNTSRMLLFMYHIAFCKSLFLTYQLSVFVGVFCTEKNRVVKIVHSSSEVVLQTIKHMVIYPGSGPSLEVIALRPVT